MWNFTRMFVYAINGIWHTIKTERNMRFHILAAVLVTTLAVLTDQSATEINLLTITIALVISMELVNTALERIADTLPDTLDAQRGIIKDIGAGAVFITAIASVFVGLIIFYDVIKSLLTYL